MSSRRITALDGLRGLAALSVVFHHCLLVFPHLTAAIREGIVPTEPVLAVLAFSPLHLFWAGSEAVVLFFVLSGFVLALPFAASHAPPSYSSFVVRRFFRIYMPYLVALFGGVVLLSTLSRFGDARLSVWFNEQWLRPLGLGDVVNWLAMTGEQTMLLNSPIWSLAHEMRLSLVFPLLAFMVMRTARWSRTLLAAAWLMLLPLPLVGVLGPPFATIADTVHYAGLFVVGALLAKHREYLTARVASLGVRWAAALLCAALALYLYRWLLQVELPEGDIIVGAGAVLFILLASTHGSRWLATPVSRWLGRISYSLYLTHSLVLLSLIYTVGQVLPVWVAVVATPPVALVVADLLERIVERPSIAMGRALTTPRRRRGALGVLPELSYGVHLSSPAGRCAEVAGRVRAVLHRQRLRCAEGELATNGRQRFGAADRPIGVVAE